MMDIPLSLTRILEYGASVHGNTTVTTWHGEGTGSEFGPAEKVTFRDIAARAAAFAHVLHDDLGITGGQFYVELRRTPRGHVWLRLQGRGFYPAE